MKSSYTDPEIPWSTLRDEFGIMASNPPRRYLADGFSGAQLWLIEGEPALLVRCHAEHATVDRLRQVQRLLKAIYDRGCPFVPVPHSRKSGDVVATIDGFLWQVEPFLPGAADFPLRPSRARRDAMMTAVAKWHLAAAELRDLAAELCQSTGTFAQPIGGQLGIPGIRRRQQQLDRLTKPGPNGRTLFEQLARWPEHPGAVLLHAHADAFLHAARRMLPVLERELRDAERLSVPQQICIRDLSQDHVLFSGKSVTGIVDYDAVSIDSIAADLARLLGSSSAIPDSEWDEALDVYDACRPLLADERRLIFVFDRANRILSGLQWLQWIVVENRQFPWEKVSQRLESLRTRLIFGD